MQIVRKYEVNRIPNVLKSNQLLSMSPRRLATFIGHYQLADDSTHEKTSVSENEPNKVLKLHNAHDVLK